MMLASVIAFITFTFIAPHYSKYAEYGYWSVVTIAAITQSGLKDTYLKGLMRLIGTIIGALIGYLCAILAHGHIGIVLILFFIFVTFTSYIAIQHTIFSYAGVISGVTMIIVLASSLIAMDLLFGIAVFRSLEVIKGIIILFLINLLLAFILDLPEEQFSIFWQKLKSLPNEFTQFRHQSMYVKAAIKISLACLFTLGIWIYFRQLEGIWAAITCLLIMEESKEATRIKSMLRFWAHVIAALFGGICAIVIGDHLIWRVIPLALSFLVCGFIIGKENKYSSLGNTTGIAVAIMLLASPGFTSSFKIIGARFLNVLFGIIVSVIVTHYLWPRQKKA